MKAFATLLAVVVLMGGAPLASDAAPRRGALAPTATPAAEFQRRQVQSSLLTSIGYQPSTKTLELVFRSGSVRHYLDVPEKVFRAFLAAPSKGRFYHQHVRKQYPSVHPAEPTGHPAHVTAQPE